MCSGRQPAITVLIATFSALIATWRFVMKATWASGSSPTASSMVRTAGSVGGTTGSPSVQPRL